MTQEKSAARDQFSKQARLKGVSELSVPAEIVVLDSLPLLGSGKPDYVAALALANERANPGKPVEAEEAA